MTLSPELLKHSYEHAVSTLIPYTKQARSCSNFKINQLSKLFKNECWTKVKVKSGHSKYENKVTNVVVEFQNHTGQKDSFVKKQIQKQVLDQVQTHLNILCNYIFKYTAANWKVEPDYRTAMGNYAIWIQTKELPSGAF